MKLSPVDRKRLKDFAMSLLSSFQQDFDDDTELLDWLEIDCNSLLRKIEQFQEKYEV